MTERLNMGALQELVQDAMKIDQLRSRFKELTDAVHRVSKLQEELQQILGSKPVVQAEVKVKKGKGKKAGKQPHPKPGSAPGKLCSILGTEPKSVQQIAKEAGWTKETVKSYLHQFDCFQNVWGKGYVHNPQVHGKQEIQEPVAPKPGNKSKKKAGK